MSKNFYTKKGSKNLAGQFVFVKLFVNYFLVSNQLHNLNICINATNITDVLYELPYMLYLHTYICELILFVDCVPNRSSLVEVMLQSPMMEQPF